MTPNLYHDLKQVRIIDGRGSLSVVEKELLPFTPRRIFWVQGVPAGETRGFHAHKAGMQAWFCLKGEIEVSLKFKGEQCTKVLQEGMPGLFIAPQVWGEQTYLTEDSILLVLSSLEYDESDYIRDFDEFRRLIQ